MIRYRTLLLFNDPINSLKSFSILIFELVIQVPETLNEIEALGRGHGLQFPEICLRGFFDGTLHNDHGGIYCSKSCAQKQTQAVFKFGTAFPINDGSVSNSLLYWEQIDKASERDRTSDLLITNQLL
jgi:hypothetical protein